ncbi:MAG TPA: hypothetical protein VLS25_09370, partial [Dehalococcoidia bacterium]|nr:hypothetical protein [Dehalococcoidia bacterium]
MKREDFIIGRIPPGYQVWDLDLALRGEATCVLVNPEDDSAQPRLMFGDEVVPLPPEAIIRREREPFITGPSVRWTGSNVVVLVGYSAIKDDTNAI